jgi:hypothetical protein
MAHQKKRAMSHGKDMHRLYDRIQGLEGKRCWKVTFGYGGEVYLHCGRAVPSNNPKLPEEEGEWIVNTCGTEWRLFTPKGSVRSTDVSDIAMEKWLHILKNRKIGKVHVGIPNDLLILVFDGSYLFHVSPSRKDDKYKNVPYWEVFTPDREVLVVGPKHRWQAKRSDALTS